MSSSEYSSDEEEEVKAEPKKINKKSSMYIDEVKKAIDDYEIHEEKKTRKKRCDANKPVTEFELTREMLSKITLTKAQMKRLENKPKSIRSDKQKQQMIL